MKNNNNINEIIQVGELSPEEKLALFTKIMANRNSGKFSSLQIEEAKKFLNDVPPFPLDISIAAYYIRTTNIPYEKYLDHLREFNEDFTSVQEKILEEATNYTKTRYGIIALSLKNVINSHKDFGGLLLFISLLNNINIPRELLDTYKSDVMVDNFIYRLNTYSLLNNVSSTFPPAVSYLSIHPSVQENSLIYLNKILELEKNKQLLQPLAHTLEAYALGIINKQDLSKINILSSHCKVFLTHHQLLGDEIKNAVDGELGVIYSYLNDYKAAKQILEDSLTYFNKHKRGNYARISRFSVYLGDVYREIGNYERAKTLLEESLDIYRKHLPENHMAIARGLAHLGAVHRHLGDFKKSRDLLEESIIINKEHFFDSHPDFAWSLVHLGNTYREMGDHKRAIDLLEEALLVYKKVFPKNHPTIAWNLGQLGNMYREVGNYQKAKKLLEESLVTYQRYFPNSYDRIAWSLTHLGDIYTYLGDYTKARNSLEKAFLIHEKHFSRNHAGVARTLMCLGNTYKELGNYKKAKDTLEESLLVHQKYFSENHLRLAPVFMYLGIVHREMGHYNQAKTFLKKSLTIYEKNIGNHSIEIARVLRNLGRVYLLENQIETAENHVKSALKMFLQNKHSESYISLEILSEIYAQKYTQSMNEGDIKQSQSFKTQSLDYLNQALDVVKTRFPKDSPHIRRIESKLKNLGQEV